MNKRPEKGGYTMKPEEMFVSILAQNQNICGASSETWGAETRNLLSPVGSPGFIQSRTSSPNLD
jgi:hypothetical protein